MPVLLSFDTATRHLEVCVSEDTRVLASRSDDSEHYSHAERLNVFIDEVVSGSGRSLNALDAVAVGIGPGSYTGLRIGTSAAKGLCFALGKPLIGMSTLDVLVHELRMSSFVIHGEDVLMPMIDARRMEVFTTDHDPGRSSVGRTYPLILDTAWCASLPSGHRTIVFGDGADKAQDLWTGFKHVVHVPGVKPAAKGLAACSDAYAREGRFADLAYLVPDYGKAANVTRAR